MGRKRMTRSDKLHLFILITALTVIVFHVLSGRVATAIVTGKKKCLVGGVWISKDAEVSYLKDCRVIVVFSSKVGEMRGTSKVGVMWDTSQVVKDNRQCATHPKS